MKGVVLGGLIALGAGGAALALPYWSGGVAQEQYERARDALAAEPSVRVLDRAYERGVRRSTARTEIALARARLDPAGEWLPEEAGDELVVVLEDTVHHGPLLPGGDDWVGAARIESVVRPGERLARVSSGLERDTVLATARTLVRLDGSSRIRYSAPDRDWQEGDVRLRLAGVGGTAELTAALDRMDGDLRVDELRLDGPDGGFRLTGLQAEGEGRALTPRLWVGRSDVRIAAIEAQGGGEAVTLEGVRLTGSSDAVDGALRAEVEVAIQRAERPGGGFRDARLRASMRNVDQAVLEQLMDWGEAVEAGRMSEDEQMRRLMGAWPDLLARNPRLAVDELRVVTPEGPVTADGSLEWRGGEANVNNPFALVNGIGVELRLRSPRSWLQARLDETIGANGAGTLATLQEQGLVVIDGGDVHADIRLRDGAVHANGRNMGSVWQLLGLL